MIDAPIWFITVELLVLILLLVAFLLFDVAAGRLQKWV